MLEFGVDPAKTITDTPEFNLSLLRIDGKRERG